MPTVIEGRDGLRRAIGTDVVVGPWQAVRQGDIDAFAAATGDRQWIHVDPRRAAAGPFGTTVAHGLLTLSMAAAAQAEGLDVRGFAAALNYGYDRVRFPAPVPVGSRVRVRLQIVAVDDVTGGVQVSVRQVVDVEGGAKPACVADALARYLDEDDGS